MYIKSITEFGHLFSHQIETDCALTNVKDNELQMAGKTNESINGAQQEEVSLNR